MVEVRDRSNDVWGGRKFRRALENRGEADIPAASTITRGYTASLRSAYVKPEPAGRSIRGHGGASSGRARTSFGKWTSRGTSPFTAGVAILSPRSMIIPVTISFSPPAATSRARRRAAIKNAFRRYGLPLAMLMDNGPPWGDPGGDPLTPFSVWLMRLGVRVLHGRPRHPQTQGKEERFHRTFKAEVVGGFGFRDLPECQRAFDDWRPRYNHERPHEALDMATPANATGRARARSPRSCRRSSTPLATRSARSTATASSASRTAPGASAGLCGASRSLFARPTRMASSPCATAPTGPRLSNDASLPPALQLVDNAARRPQGPQAATATADRLFP